MINLKSILGKLFVNDKQIVTLDDTAENGAIESGSNANGSYTKFPDGTLICSCTVSLNSVADLKTFAHAFIDTSYYVGTTPITPSTMNIVITPIIRLRTNTAISLYCIQHTGTTTSSGDYDADVVAIGRWK